jgi:hypothetical protein
MAVASVRLDAGSLARGQTAPAAGTHRVRNGRNRVALGVTLLPIRSRAPRWILAVAAVVLLGSACTAGDEAAGETASTSPPPTEAPSLGLTRGQVVAILAVDDQDRIEGEERTVTAQGEPGDRREPSTLGYCSAPLAMEASRYQRLEVELADGDEFQASVDAALYPPGRAELALQELRIGETRCQADQPVAPQQWEEEVQPSAWSTEALVAGSEQGLTADHWARTITRTPAGGATEVTTVIAQRHGDALVVVTAAEPSRALTLAASAAERLATTESHLIDG